MHDARTARPRRCLILLPGFDGTGRLFAPLQKVLDPHIETTAISYPTDKIFGYDSLCEHVARQLPDREFAIVAESFSGPIALEIARRKPEGLKLVILSASFVRNPRPILLRAASLLFGFLRPRLSVPVWAIREFLLGRNAPLERCHEVQELQHVVEQDVIAFRLQEIIRVNVVAALSSCRVPLIYLNATEDRILGKETWRTLVSAKPDTQVFHVPGPHLLLQASPNLCARHIVDAANSVVWAED